ncbi:MAG TPA: hypothetical protein VKY27_09475 [Bacteriovoracaceae bacterium]|nr:hypothetical protein [Bacteriovoracaceae bacterium]
MKLFFGFLFFSALLTNTVYASMGESDTECLQMQESNERSNPKANLEQIKQDKKPSSSTAVRG